MTYYKSTLTAVLGTLLLMVSCSQGDETISSSQINTDPPILNDLDLWIREHFVTPYNIEVQYKWDINNSNIERYLHPPFEASVKPVLELLEKVWIEPFSELGGPEFVKKIAPRQITLVGSFNYNPNSPTITLGVAEAGKKITLFNIDYLDFSNINSIKEPLKTMQHEYGHILNQTIPFTPTYGQITPENYTAQWYNLDDAEARKLGFITAYASSKENEDFVEMVSEMLTNSKEDFDAIIDAIPVAEPAEGEEASTVPSPRDIIRQKQAIVVEYYSANFGIDLYELQALTEAAIKNLVTE